MSSLIRSGSNKFEVEFFKFFAIFDRNLYTNNTKRSPGAIKINSDPISIKEISPIFVPFTVLNTNYDNWERLPHAQAPIRRIGNFIDRLALARLLDRPAQAVDAADFAH